MPAPLDGLRVLELATGVAGPYAARLLGMLGATVVKVEPPGGDPARSLPVDDGPLVEPSPVFVHLNAGKRMVRADRLDRARAREWAEVVIDDRVRARMGSEPLGRVHVSVTAWGFDAGDAGHPGDELLVQAASGVMTVAGEPGREPLRLPGWQSQYLAGAYAAAGALAALGDGERHHVDVSWVAAISTGVEAGMCAFLQAASGPGGEEAVERQAGLQSSAFPAGVFRCADGHVIPGTVRPVDWTLQCQVYERPDLLQDEQFSWRNRWDNRERLREVIQPWYDAHGKHEIFEKGLDAGWAVGMVMTAADALEDRHLAERAFLSALEGAVSAVLPGRPWRSPGISEGGPVPLGTAGADDEWFARETTASGRPVAPVAPPPPETLRVLELTWAWAGPFVGRFLGGFGADVVKVEAGRWPDGWRTRLRWRDLDVALPDGVDPDELTWDAAALFNSLNRNKRSVSIDLTFEEGRHLFLALARVADALIVNTSYSTLADRGVEAGVLAAVDDGLVLVQMPALGATGPYRAMPGYGILIEGMGGLAARLGYEHEGARATSTYYPDAVAGVHATVAVLAALAQARRTGRGAVVDLSQQEVMWLQLGEGIVLRSMVGREPGRPGNREPGHPGSGVFAVDGADRWVARVDGRDQPVMTHQAAYAGGTLAARGLLEDLDHPVTGRRSYLRVPVRVDGAPVGSRRPAPLFAAHTDDVLAQWLGLDGAHLARLRERRVIGTTPQQLRRETT